MVGTDMLLWVLLLVGWLATCVCVASLCVAAAAGDRAQLRDARRTRPSLRRSVRRRCNAAVNQARARRRTRV